MFFTEATIYADRLTPAFWAWFPQLPVREGAFSYAPCLPLRVQKLSFDSGHFLSGCWLIAIDAADTESAIKILWISGCAPCGWLFSEGRYNSLDSGAAATALLS